MIHVTLITCGRWQGVRTPSRCLKDWSLLLYPLWQFTWGDWPVIGNFVLCCMIDRMSESIISNQICNWFLMFVAIMIDMQIGQSCIPFNKDNYGTWKQSAFNIKCLFCFILLKMWNCLLKILSVQHNYSLKNPYEIY